MESLILDKFQDVKLDNKQLSFIHAGDTCTGGGIVMRVNLARNRGHYYICEHYESDSTDQWRYTTYSGYSMYETHVFSN